MFIKFIAECIITIFKNQNLGEKIIKYIYEKYQVEIDKFIIANLKISKQSNKALASNSYYEYLMRMWRGLL